MGILRDSIDGNGLGTAPAPDAEATTQRLPAVAAPPGAGGAVPPPPASPAPQRAELESRRDALARQVIEMHWDLGGLAYEMAVRDHFRLDVLLRRAAGLQECDAELAEVERLLRMEPEGVAGKCPVCQAPHSRGALYCWQCGGTLIERLPAGAAGAGE